MHRPRVRAVRPVTLALHFLLRLFLAALREADEERESGPRTLRPEELRHRKLPTPPRPSLATT